MLSALWQGLSANASKFINGFRAPVLSKPGTLPFDAWVLVAAISVLMISFIMISSASMDVAEKHYGFPYFYMLRQGIYIVIGLVLCTFVSRIPISFWQKHANNFMFLSLLLLVLVLIPGIGNEVKGSRRWIPLGLVNLQVSEVAKICMVFFVASYVMRRLDEVRTRKIWMFKLGMPLGLYIGLLLLEPDFGASVVLAASIVTMIFLSGIKLFHFFIIIILAIMGGALMAIASPYRVARLQNFLDPWADRFGDGYQLTQAQIAFGRGGWFGEGLGNSIQKLFYLPEAHTDFVISIMAEELGFIGILFLVSIYIILIYRMFRIGRRAEKFNELFMAYIAYGFTSIFACQFLINIGVNVGALPTKGLTLPLISYGGSSLMVSLVMITLLLRVDFELKQKRLLYTQKMKNHAADDGEQV